MSAASTQDLMDHLETLGIETNTVEHPPLFTVAESKEHRGQLPGGHTKNLFLKDKKNNFYLLVVDEDADIDMKTMHKRLGSARLSFGNSDYLMEKLGVIPGAVTAFSVLNDGDKSVRIIFDEELMKNELLNCHPLINTATTTIKTEDLIKFIKSTEHEPEVMNLTSDLIPENG